MELLDRIMEYRGKDEHPRKTFHRLRRSGLLDDIPGLVYREGDEREPARASTPAFSGWSRIWTSCRTRSRP
jgi:hypothetical protein